MKRTAILALAGALGAAGGGQGGGGLRYLRGEDKKTCAYTHSKASDAGPESCEFSCEGPVAGVRTKLLSCADYDHLYVQVDGKSYSTWDAMLAVGRFSGLANKNGMVEWVFAPGGAPSREKLNGLIVRFQGVDQDNKGRNALAVFSLKPGEICWKGNYPANEAARAAVDGAACRSLMTEER